MGIQDNLKRGTIEMILLTILSDGEKYGYEIAQDITNRSQGLYKLNEATLYPTLYRLKKNGYLNDKKVLVVGKRSRVYYTLTDKGNDYLSEIHKEYEQISNAIRNILTYKE